MKSFTAYGVVTLFFVAGAVATVFEYLALYRAILTQ